MNKLKLSGIYPISPHYIKSDDDYLEKCFNAISSGINIFQFRSPYFSMRKKRYLLGEIYKYCVSFDVQLMINNDYNLASLQDYNRCLSSTGHQNLHNIYIFHLINIFSFALKNMVI